MTLSGIYEQGSPEEIFASPKKPITVKNPTLWKIPTMKCPQRSYGVMPKKYVTSTLKIEIPSFLLCEFAVITTGIPIHAKSEPLNYRVFR